MLSVIRLSIIRLSIIRLSVIRLSAIGLSVIRLRVIRLSVVAPPGYPTLIQICNLLELLDLLRLCSFEFWEILDKLFGLIYNLDR